MATDDLSIHHRPQIRGKFLYLGDEKFFVKGVTYGAFPPNSRGYQFPESGEVDRDFARMRAAGINTLLTYTVPPATLLDQAQHHGLRVIVTIPWMEYVAFLEGTAIRREIREEVRRSVRACRGHPAVLMYCVGKEIPPQIVRWHGRRRIEGFLRDLYHAAKDEDPHGLMTYTNFPTTEYLDLSFVDVYTFNVYLHERRTFCRYLSHLQHLAQDLPLVLTEFGLCSFRHGRDGQAEFLDWQIEEIFDHGLAGGVIFGWTDPFFQDGTLITEWGFGLVDAGRNPKPSYAAVQARFARETPFPLSRRWPKVSVIVALHNAESTLDDCLSSLVRLRYPDYEVIVVDDGSTDGSAGIIRRYPFRTLRTPRRGVGAARNTGAQAAAGDIIAYIDSDAHADPDWLSYLAATFLESDVAAVGGPNPVPPEDRWVAKCVFRSPGGPTQVMLDDESAEHIPGCNMAFSASALRDVGGFDPVFTKAGDDVDICWRLLEQGRRIGFNPSAIVWHHRRPTVRAYWRQQVGYGEAESLLERKFPNRFNPWGHTHWSGRIYAPYPFFRLRGRPRIYHGLWGSAGFQAIYGRSGQGVLTFLPRAMEWHLAVVAAALLGLFAPWLLVAAGLGIAYTLFYAAFTASHASLRDLLAAEEHPSRLTRLRWRATLAVLHVLEPLARDWGRLRGGLVPWRGAGAGLPTGHPGGSEATGWVEKGERAGQKGRRRWRLQPLRRSLSWAYAGGMGFERFAFLQRLTTELTARRCAVGWGSEWDEWDLKAGRGVLGQAHVRLTVEHHGGPRRLLRLSALIHLPGALYALLLLLVSLGAWLAWRGSTLAAAGVAVFFGGFWVASVRETIRLEGLLRSAADEVAGVLNGSHED